MIKPLVMTALLTLGVAFSAPSAHTSVTAAPAAYHDYRVVSRQGDVFQALDNDGMGVKFLRELVGRDVHVGDILRVVSDADPENGPIAYELLASNR